MKTMKKIMGTVILVAMTVICCPQVVFAAEEAAEYVPAISSPVGGNSTAPAQLENHDLNSSPYRNGWGRNSGVYGASWFHSDMKDMAYFYVYPLYDELKTKGNLK